MSEVKDKMRAQQNELIEAFGRTNDSGARDAILDKLRAIHVASAALGIEDEVMECCEDGECEECCEHTDMDDFHCMNCGLDRTEDMMCRAYDDAKARRQDGE